MAAAATAAIRGTRAGMPLPCCLPACPHLPAARPASCAAPPPPQGVSFLGPSDEFVMSGSDCGHVFVWDARTGEVLSMRKVRGGGRAGGDGGEQGGRGADTRCAVAGRSRLPAPRVLPSGAGLPAGLPAAASLTCLCLSAPP